jgi:hypothetical protein
MPVNGRTMNLEWSGLPQTAGMAHAIAYTADLTSGLITGYQGYSSTSVVFDGTTTSGQNYTVDLTPPASPIVTGELSGSIDGVSGDRINELWLSFADHAAMMLVQDDSPSQAFSYLVPKLPGAKFTVYASAGSPTTGSFALAHRSRDAQSAADSALDFALPHPATLSTPLAGATVTTDTAFTWQSENPVSILTLVQDSDTGPHQIHVVTAEKSARVPEWLWQHLLQAGDLVWFVETQGLATSLDAVTSSASFLDPFMRGRVAAPVRADGFYASSSGRLVVAP